MKYNRFGILTILLAPFFLSGCLFLGQFASDPIPPAEVRPDPKPLQVAKTKPIAFHKILFKIPAGTPIVNRYTSSRRRINSLPSKGGSFSVAGEYRVIARKELRNYGYNVIGEDNDLFDDADNSYKARYQLGGVVSELSFNIFVGFPNDLTEVKMDIKWQLRDAIRRETIFTTTTTGSGASSTSKYEAEYAAFKDGLLRLLEKKEFARLMDDSIDNDQKETYAQTIPIKTRKSIKNIRVPRDINTIMRGVVLVQVGKSHATGFFISSNGYILTAAHVVAGVQQATITTKSGLELQAKVVRLNQDQDLALLKVPGNGHFALPIETDSLPSVGSELYVVGSPFSKDLSFSVAKGILSAIRKDTGHTYIQTDASMNQGNSGGPILGENGTVVGVASWKISSAEGLSFGIPTTVVAKKLKLNLSEEEE